MEPIDVSSDSDFDFSDFDISDEDIAASPERASANSKIHLSGASPPSTTLSNADYGNLSSPLASKWALPAPVQPSAHVTRLDKFEDGASSSQAQNIHKKMYHRVGPTFNRASVKDDFIRSNNNEIVSYEKSGSRFQPPSSMHGRSISSAPSAVTNDLVPRLVAGDDKFAGSDERLIFKAALQDLYQPKVEATMPDGLLSVPLLKHQKIALAWMLQRETRSLHCLGGILADDQGLGKTISMIALIQMQKFLESNSKSEGSIKKTEALNLDEDDDGNDGPYKLNQTTECNDTRSVAQVSSSKKTCGGQRPAAGNLIVCPASILCQWARELDDKVADEAKLSVLVYHGGSRTKDPIELAKYDVVLTTYAIVTVEVPKQPLVDENDIEENMGSHGSALAFSINKRKNVTNVSKKRKKARKGLYGYDMESGSGPLARVGWSRVILDECQTIKNHRTQIARACCSLRAKRRWCLSGTPIQNTIEDLYSYFRFLRYEPYNVYKSFYTTIKVPISRNSFTGYKKLQVVLKSILLRRTKGTLINGEPIINLPPKSISLEKVDFSREERAFYNWLEADSRSKFKAYAAAGTVKLNYASILLMLLRLRQACDHPILVKGYSSESGGKRSVETAKRLPSDMVVDLLKCLAASSAICCVCYDPPEDPVVTMCRHVFCFQCVSDRLSGDDIECPASDCKHQLGPDLVYSEATLRSCAADNVCASLTHPKFDENSMVWQKEYCSSKIRAVLEILLSNCAVMSPNAESTDWAKNKGAQKAFSSSPTKGPIKSLIFSQWTGMLDLVADVLEEYHIEFRKLDGRMTLAARDRAVKDFSTDPEVTVLLMSLKAGNLGLNMVAACHVILLDLWWNPTTEDQAIDRAHRIGQTRPVTVYRLTVKDTVEDRMLALQEEKRKMVSSALGEDQTGGSTTRLTMQDLRYLFNLDD